MSKDRILKIVSSVILILFCIQYIPLESRAGVSILKLSVSMLCPLILIAYSFKASKVMILSLVYYLLVVIAALRFPQSLRWSTIIYLGTFIIVFVTYNNLLYVNKVFTTSYYMKLLRFLIGSYIVVLIIQQIFILIGIKYFPLINLTQNLNRGIGANSLSYEPSTAAMVLCFAFLSLLRMHEISYGYKPSVKDIYRKEKWLVIGFLWSMLTMGSGTAFVCLALLSIYFLDIMKKNIIKTICALIVLICIFFFVDYEPLNRARNTIEAFFSLNIDNAILADASSAYRTQLWINTLTKLDLSSFNGWLGNGVDYGQLSNESFFNPHVMIGSIADYGFMSFLILVLIVYNSMIRYFFSLETLFWCIILLATLNNEPFRWGCMMMFATVRYFQINESKNID